MKLIKLNPEHFIVVNDFYESKNDIKQEDVNSFFYHKEEGIVFVDRIVDVSLFCYNIKTEFFYASLRKITHSTQPLDGVELISLSEVRELLGEVDVEKLAELNGYPESSQFYDYKEGFIDGYEQAVEDNKEKKYTEDDINNALSWGYHAAKDEARGIGSSGYGTRFFESIKTKPKTEWDVEFVDRILRLI